MLQYVHVSDDGKERQKGEDYKELHRLGVSIAVVLVLGFAEHERLVGVAEGLCYHRHNHRYLACRAVNAELGMGVGSLVDVRENDFICRLVEYSGDSEHQYWPAVAEHSLKQRTVEDILEARKFLPEKERYRAGAEQVDVERIANTYRRVVYLAYEALAAAAFIQRGEQHEEHQVEADVHYDEQHLERGELYRALLVAQIRERNGLERVERYGQGHRPDVGRMVGIAHRR